MANKLPRHIINLLLLLSFFLLLALAAKSWLTDPSYYRFGHYRADAVPEIAAPAPVIQGAAYCQTCHDERKSDWPVGAHRTVQCEVCHGVDGAHPDDGLSLVPTDTIRLCTTCHEAMPARPAFQPQIVLGQHPFPDEETPECLSCHDPHSPGEPEEEIAVPDTGSLAEVIAESPVSTPAMVSKCAKCHGELGEGKKKNPALAGLQREIFVERMGLYRNGERKNKTMAKLAKDLSDEEIAELAIYYESLAGTPAN